jgi:hypothetical protein
MADQATRIVRPWGVFGGRYEVAALGYRYYCLAWIASFTGMACVLMHALGLISIYRGYALFLVALAFAVHFTRQTTRHGRRITG